MRARDLAEPYPMVELDTDALTAVRLFEGRRLPGLIVVDGDGRPFTVLPGSQVLRFAIPRYVQDDPKLAQVFDERSSDELWSRLSEVRVRDVLPRSEDPQELPVVDGDATSLEIAAVMARMRSPVVAVVEEGEVLGAVTVSRLLQHLLPDDAAPL
jgi:CBS domain-containing protein